MRRLARVGSALALCSVLAAACGSGAGDEASRTPRMSTTAQGSPAPDAGGSDAPETPDASGGASAPGGDGSSGGSGGSSDGSSGDSGSDTPDGSPDPDQPVSGPPPAPTGIVASVTPSCAGHGDAVRVVIETDPLADVSYAIAFADGDHHNLFGLAQADLEGRFVWNFAVPAEAALGDADIITTSGHPDHGAKKGQGTLRVTDDGECP